MYKGNIIRGQAAASSAQSVHLKHSMSCCRCTALPSRTGTPTDNAAMESINGWIKAGIFMDFHVTGESPVEQEVAAGGPFDEFLDSSAGKGPYRKENKPPAEPVVLIVKVQWSIIPESHYD